MMVMAGSAICGLVIVAGWWLFSEKTSPPPALQQESRSGMPPTATAPVAAKVAGDMQTTTAAVELPKPSADLPVSRVSGQQQEVPEAPTVNRPPAMTIVEPQETLPDPVQPAEPAIQAETEPGPAIKDVIKAPEVAAVTIRDSSSLAVEDIPGLHDPAMKLQAITWSTKPQNRIAVINNRIMRQGDSVSGYRLVTINQDDVILSAAGERWKLPFRLK